MPDLYALLFKQCFFYGTVLVGNNDIIYYAMQEFGGYDMTKAALIATVATTLGTLVNVLIGFVIIWLVRKFHADFSEFGYATFHRYYNRFGIYTLLLTPIAPFYILAAAAGIFRTNPLIIMLFILIGRAFHYLLPVVMGI